MRLGLDRSRVSCRDDSGGGSRRAEGAMLSLSKYSGSVVSLALLVSNSHESIQISRH